MLRLNFYLKQNDMEDKCPEFASTAIEFQIPVSVAERYEAPGNSTVRTNTLNPCTEHCTTH